jgi:FkbM family methyltransferase
VSILQGTVRKCQILSGVMTSYRNPVIPVLDRLGLLRRKETIVSLRNGLRLKVRTRTSDLPVVNEMFVHDAYSPIFNCGNVAAPRVGIDIGAHIGTFTTLAAARFPSLRLYSFEPSPENFRLLQENICLNGLGSRVVPVPKAVAGKRGEMRLFVSDHDTGGGSLYAGGNAADPQRSFGVNTIVLQDVFDEFGLRDVDFLKMDCEGGEYEIFYATPASYIRRISRMVVEYHTHTHAHWQEEKARLKAFLGGLGYDVQESDRYSLLYVTRL